MLLVSLVHFYEAVWMTHHWKYFILIKLTWSYPATFFKQELLYLGKKVIICISCHLTLEVRWMRYLALLSWFQSMLKVGPSWPSASPSQHAPISFWGRQPMFWSSCHFSWVIHVWKCLIYKNFGHLVPLPEPGSYQTRSVSSYKIHPSWKVYEW